LRGRGAREEAIEFLAQRLGGLEAPLGREVVFPESVDRARDVPRDRIDRLLRSGEAFGGARIEELLRSLPPPGDGPETE